jgi:LacI family transcriptional regulator
MKKADTPVMSTRQEITIYDIADHLGVSSSTVSRGLQNHPTISESTRREIAAAAAALGYQRNLLAGSLRSRITRTIGVIVHDLNNQFMSSVLTGIGSVASDAGYDVIIAYSAQNTAKEALNAQNFLKRRVDGVIASPVCDNNDMSHFRLFHDKKVPVIFFDGAAECPDSSMVVIDNAGSGYQATQHLLRQGCRRIVLVTGNKNREVYAQRYKGYAEALRDHGISVDDSLVLTNGLNEAAGIEAADAIMRMYPRPDGAFITDDYTAAVCMHKLTDAGWSIPEDLAIVGFNYDFISKVVSPQLTTIQYPGIEIGEIAARSLIDHLKGYYSNGAARIVVRSQLVKRASSQRLGQM